MAALLAKAALFCLGLIACLLDRGDRRAGRPAGFGYHRVHAAQATIADIHVRPGDQLLDLLLILSAERARQKVSRIGHSPLYSSSSICGHKTTAAGGPLTEVRCTPIGPGLWPGPRPACPLLAVAAALGSFVLTSNMIESDCLHATGIPADAAFLLRSSPALPAARRGTSRSRGRPVPV